MNNKVILEMSAQIEELNKEIEIKEQETQALKKKRKTIARMMIKIEEMEGVENV